MEPSVDPLAELDFDVREPGWWLKPALVRLGLLALVIGVVIMAWDERADAHGGITLTVSSDGRGAVRVTAQWRDGHAITDPLGATLTATADNGQRVGPVPLRPTGPGPGTVSYPGPLPAGGWAVVVDVGTPGIARCEARITVAAADGPAAAPTSLLCPAPAEAAAAASDAVSTAAAADTGQGRPWLWVSAAAGVVALAALGFALVRRPHAVAPAAGSGRATRSVRRPEPVRAGGRARR